MNFRKDLLRVRAGELSFPALIRIHQPMLRRWSAYFYGRWKQRVLDSEDIYQEMVLACWRAIDAWDPELTPDIEKFVRYQVGKRARHEIERVLGWPRPILGRAPVKMRSLLPGDERGLVIYRHRIDADLPSLVLTLGPLGRDVVAGVLSGYSFPETAHRLYGDPERRDRYRWDTHDDAVEAVHRAGRRLVNHFGKLNRRNHTATS